ncbi:MAG: hypothetical protein WBE26_15085 [Phycisphaerae bacterium]
MPDAAILEPCVSEQGTNGTRNRYLAFSGGLVEGEPYPHDMAIRVKFVTIPGNPNCEGQSMWVVSPRDVSELSNQPGALPLPNFVAATLDCEPEFADWSIYEDLYVFHEYIVPGATYEVQFVPMGCEPLEDAYSPPLKIRTNAWGDVVGEYYTNPDDCWTSSSGYVDCWSPPNGVVNFDDISSLVDKFRNLYGAPRKARADIAGEPPIGLPYPFAYPPDVLCP